MCIIFFIPLIPIKTVAESIINMPNWPRLTWDMLNTFAIEGTWTMIH